MAQLPADRTKLNAAVQNQQPSFVADAIANREALVEAYDTIDLLNQKVDTAISNGKMGNEISSDVDMRGYRIRNLAAPISNTDVARKAEVDAKLSLSGGTMTGLLTALGGIDLEVSSVPTGKIGRMHANGATNQIYYHDGTDWREVWHGGNNPASVSANGYHKLASGLIVQWGVATIPSGGGIATFPIAFPTSCVNVQVTADMLGTTTVTINNKTPTQVTITQNSGTDLDIQFLAIGY